MPKLLSKATPILQLFLLHDLCCNEVREESAPTAFLVLNGKHCHFPSFSRMSSSNNRVLDSEGSKPILSFYRSYINPPSALLICKAADVLLVCLPPIFFITSSTLPRTNFFPAVFSPLELFKSSE